MIGQRWRLYFNAHGDRPWCVSPDHDDAEEHPVTSVYIDAAGTTHYDPMVARRPDHSGPPSAYLVLNGELDLRPDGSASIVLT